LSVREPTPEQRRAADPTRSVWVDANAGTGKTRVLTDRVLRLLLAGAPPASILCLTFTKAAAGEMAGRVVAKLAEWATLDDAVLDGELEALEARPADARLRTRARGLHDAVLALPDGLAVMTVHSLAQRLLRRFPLEAGVPASFEVIDERSRGELLDEARERVLGAAAQDAELADDLALLAAHAADATLLAAVDALVAERRRWIEARDGLGGLDAVLVSLAAALDVAGDGDADASETGADVVAAGCAEQGLDREALRAAAASLAARGSKTRVEAASAIRAWLDADPSAREALLPRYRAALATFDEKREPPVWRPNGQLVTDKLAREDPDTAAAIVAEVERLDRLAARERAQRTYRRTAALLRTADRVLDAFEHLKAQAAVLDFDDLLLKARALLASPGAGDWVRFKLDQAYTHILVDEAQDTNTLQWAIVELLADEVFAGAGTRPAGGRTLFVVGDAKQSIYRFQGADPEATAAVRARLERRARAAGLPLDAVALTRCFRSSQAVLDVVDAMLAEDGVRGLLGDAPAHHAFATTKGGRVELWPLEPAPETAAARDPFEVPPRGDVEDRSERRLARRIARQVRRHLDAATPLPGGGRPLRAGDVMVLLRKRDPLLEPLVRAFKQADVPVVGADRIALTGHLAVQDLMALGEAVLLPENDFALACALKSPLFGLDEDRLFRLAHHRAPGQSLHQAWREAAQTDDELAHLWRRYRRWQRLADFVPAYEFFLRVLGGAVGDDPDRAFAARPAFLRRFGAEAAEPLDAFVDQALAYEQGHAATLQGFLDWLGRGEDDLKREAAAGGDGVRVLTVHGAKGLEAPVVILADAGPREAPRRDRLLWADDPALPLWRPARSDATPLSAAARARERRGEAADDLRLLYVAATRASEWLIVAGAETRRTATDTSWHARLDAALERLDASTSDDGRRVHATGVAAPAAATPAAAGPPIPAPACLRRPAPPARRPRVRRPSDAGTAAKGPGTGEGRAALTVGTHVHRLLERLPPVAESARERALDAALAASGELDDALRARIRRQVLTTIAHPELAPLFAPGAWAEQPVVGEVDGERVVGVVDRMAIVGGELWLADFKTGWPPAAGEAMPETYARQLAAYARVLAPLFAELEMRPRLVWCETGAVQRLGRPMPASARSGGVD
jgi:ATP-dependent helicase/nuclease subunit A